MKVTVCTHNLIFLAEAKRRLGELREEAEINQENNHILQVSLH